MLFIYYLIHKVMYHPQSSNVKNVLQSSQFFKSVYHKKKKVPSCFLSIHYKAKLAFFYDVGSASISSTCSFCACC